MSSNPNALAAAPNSPRQRQAQSPTPHTPPENAIRPRMRQHNTPAKSAQNGYAHPEKKLLIQNSNPQCKGKRVPKTLYCPQNQKKNMPNANPQKRRSPLISAMGSNAGFAWGLPSHQQPITLSSILGTYWKRPFRPANTAHNAQNKLLRPAPWKTHAHRRSSYCHQRPTLSPRNTRSADPCSPSIDRHGPLAHRRTAQRKTCRSRSPTAVEPARRCEIPPNPPCNSSRCTEYSGLITAGSPQISDKRPAHRLTNSLGISARNGERRDARFAVVSQHSPVNHTNASVSVRVFRAASSPRYTSRAPNQYLFFMMNGCGQIHPPEPLEKRGQTPALVRV